jgi:hypothetical protein
VPSSVLVLGLPLVGHVNTNLRLCDRFSPRSLMMYPVVSALNEKACCDRRHRKEVCPFSLIGNFTTNATCQYAHPGEVAFHLSRAYVICPFSVP